MVTANTLNAPISQFSSTLDCRIATADLKRAVATLARVADRRSTMPMLANVLLRVGDGGLTMAATDLNLSMVRIGASVAASGRGAVCVNAKALADIVKGLSGDTEVCLTQTGGTGLKVSDGHSEISLLGMHAQDFPRLPDPEGVEFHKTDGAAFADMLERVAFAVCKDETRFHLNGILIECDGTETRMVTTDGHRLTRHDAKLAGAPTGGKGVILPAKAAAEIAKLLKAHKGYEASLAIKAPFLHVKVGEWTVSAKLIDAQFPAYEQVIPKDYKKIASVERKPLIAALKRAQKLCTQTRGVKLSFASGKLTLTSDHPDQGTASESLKAASEWIEGGGKMVFGINATYLLDILGEIGDTWITMAFGGELDPVLVRSTEDAVSHSVQSSRYLGVVMPMRI